MEHRDAFEKRMLKLAAAEHVSEEHHPIRCKETSVAVQDRNTPANHDGGVELPGYWMVTLRRLECVANPRLPVMFADEYCDVMCCDVRGYKIAGVLTLASLFPRR